MVGSVYVLLAKDIVLEKREQEKRKQEKKQVERSSSIQEKTSPSVEHHDDNNNGQQQVPPQPPTRPVAAPNATPNVATSPLPSTTTAAVCANCGRIMAARDDSWWRTRGGQSRGQKVMQRLSDWRRRGTRAMIKLVDFVGTAAEDTFENKKFKQAKERWIQYPGEKYKNPALRETADQYRRSRDLSSSMNDQQPRSRSASIQSRRDGEAASTRTANRSPDSPSAGSPPAPWSRSPQLSRLETGTTVITNGSSGQGGSSWAGGAPLRHHTTTDSLQVPSPIHLARTRDSLPPPAPSSPTEPEVLVRGKGNRRPSVVVSDGDDAPFASPQVRHFRADSQPMSQARPPRSRHFRSRQGTV